MDINNNIIYNYTIIYFLIFYYPRYIIFEHKQIF